MSRQKTVGSAFVTALLLIAALWVAPSPHMAEAATPAPAFVADGKWAWEQVLKAGPENGEGIGGTAVSFADRFTGSKDGYPYFPSGIAAGATSCSVAGGSTNLFVEAGGTGVPCGGASDDVGINGVADWFIATAYVVIPSSATSATFLIGTAGKTNEVHAVFGAPGNATRKVGGYSAGATTFEFTADLAALGSAAGGAKVAELKVYAYDPTAGSGVSVQWSLSGAAYGAVPATNVSTPAAFIPYTVTVTPPASQTITYGDAPDLSPTSSGFVDGDSWSESPTCAVYNASNVAVSAPYPVGSYTIACAGGTLPSTTKYSADYTATSTLTVDKIQATLTYAGTTGVVSGTSITLSATVSSDCSTAGIVFTVSGSIVADPSVPYPVVDGQVYDIEVSYDDPECEAASVTATVVVGGASSASSGGGWYEVSSVGRFNFGYTVQVDPSRGGAPVAGQLVWNSQEAGVRFKGTISTFVRNTADCPTGQVCGRITGTGTLRTRDESGAWEVVGTDLTYQAAVIDAGKTTTCTTIAKKKTCTTIDKTDAFSLSVTAVPAGATTDWPVAIRLGGGNILIK